MNLAQLKEDQTRAREARIRLVADLEDQIDQIESRVLVPLTAEERG